MVPDHDRTTHSLPEGSGAGDSTAHDGAPAAAPVTATVGTRVGPYVIVDIIGAGAMGVVYAAFDPRLDRRVAIKMVRADKGEAGKGAPRLLREAQALAKLSHPNVVPIYDVGQHDDGVFLAMELVHGEDLRHWLQRGRQPWREIVATMIEAGRGLAAAHAAGIVHRDFKPDNVLLDDTGRARVTDFGLARGHGEADAPPSVRLDNADPLSATLTRTGSVVGTPSYMSPEQHTGKPVDARSDQYAFCVALYEAIYGVRPFVGRDLQELANHKWSESLSSDASLAMRRGLPPGLHALILRGLRRRPADRFADMDALLGELERVRAGGRRPLRWVVAGAGAATSVAAVAWLGAPTPCPDADDALVGVWDDDRRDRVALAFSGSETKVAIDAWPRVRDELDGFAAAWVDAHGQICTAALASGRGDPELDAGMMCLRQGRARLGGVLDVLEDGSRQSVHAADTLLATLTDPRACHDATATAQEPRVTRERQRLRETLDVADVRLDAAQYGTAREIARGVIRDAEPLGLTEIDLEARLVIAIADVRSARYQAGEDGLRAVFWGAQAAGLDAIALRAATRMVFLLGALVDRPDEGFTWLRHGQTALDRLGEGHTLARAKLLENAASLYDTAALEELGEQSLRDALAIRLQLQPEDHAAVSTVRNNLAVRLTDRGAYEEALALHRVARRNRIARLGSYHPDVAMSLINEAKPLIQLDRPDEALASLAQAEPIVRASLGDGHPMLDAIQMTRGAALLHLGEFDVARAYLQLALSSVALRAGVDSVGVGHLWNAIAVTYQRQGDAPRARLFFDRARNTFAVLGAAGELGLAYVASNRATLEFIEGDLERAGELIDAAVELFERVRPPGHPDFALVLANRAQIELGRGELADARATVQRAAEIVEFGPRGRLHAEVLGSLRLRLDWGEGTRTDIAADLLAYRARIAALDPWAVELVAIDRWLAARAATPAAASP